MDLIGLTSPTFGAQDAMQDGEDGDPDILKLESDIDENSQVIQTTPSNQQQLSSTHHILRGHGKSSAKKATPSQFFFQDKARAL